MGQAHLLFLFSHQGRDRSDVDAMHTFTVSQLQAVLISNDFDYGLIVLLKVHVRSLAQKAMQHVLYLQDLSEEC